MSGEKFKMELPALAIKDQFPWRKLKVLWMKIETEVFNREEKEIPSSLIGQIVIKKLKDLDAVAYVRFASVYREFKDVDTFMDELKKIMK